MPKKEGDGSILFVSGLLFAFFGAGAYIASRHYDIKIAEVSPVFEAYAGSGTPTQEMVCGLYGKEITPEVNEYLESKAHDGVTPAQVKWDEKTCSPVVIPGGEPTGVGPNPAAPRP